MSSHHHVRFMTIAIIFLSIHVFSSFTEPVDDGSIHDTIYDGCDDYKECFGYGFSDDCVSSRDCLAVGTVYKKDSDFIFEMRGLVGNGYVAAGLSTDSRMGDDSVVECVKTEDDVKIFMSFTGQFNVSREEVPQDTAKLLNSYIIDNTIYCRVAWPAVSQVKGLTFDLIQSDYYVMFVSGPTKSDYSLEYHNMKKASPSAVEFSKLKDVDNGSTRRKRSSSDAIYEECKKTRYTRCFGLEDKCEDKENCTAMAIVSEHEYVHTFQLVSFIGYKYIALGFSEGSKIRDDDSIFKCENRDGKVDAAFLKYQSYYGHSQKPNTEKREDGEQKAMKLRDSSLRDNRLYCRIDYDNFFNTTQIRFSHQNRYFMLTAGNDINENLKFDRVSLSKMSLSEHRTFNRPSRVLVQLHGSIMIVAWLGCCALSTLFPMHYKKCFRTWAIFNKDVWFAMHLFFNFATVILCAIGVGIILYDQGGFVDPNPHWIFAIVAMVFCLGQFVYGYLRPRPLTTAREYFKLLHWFGANMTLMFATAAVFFAIPQPKSELPRSSAWYFLLFALNFVATHGSLYLVAHYQKQVLYKPSPLAEIDEVPNPSMTPEQLKYYKFQTIRKVILWTFITITTLLICGALWLIWRDKE